MTDQEELIVLRAENAHLRQVVSELTEKFTLLLGQLSTVHIKKDSHNSSPPLSSDRYVAKTKVKSARKSGGQPGYEGTALEFNTQPDVIFDIKSDYCSKCSHQLSDNSFMLKSKRQVVQILNSY